MLHFNALAIGVKYTLLFQWINFGRKCLDEYDLWFLFLRDFL